MNFSAESIFASLLVSLVGGALLVYGKKQSRVPHMAAGVVMAAYPYFVSDVLLMLGIAVLVIAALIFAVRAGA